MDLVVKNAALAGMEPGRTVDIGIAGGKFVAIEAQIVSDAPVFDAGKKLVSPCLIETHIHLDKTCIHDRCRIVQGTVQEAISETAKAKKQFTPEDVYARGRRTLEKAILQGTGRMRTHVEIDPGIRFIGFEGVQQLAKDYAFAIDIEICAFPQEGLLNNPGTEELLIEALKRGARAIGAVPYVDSDPRGQIDRIFEIARDHDVDIDMHLDLADGPDGMQVEYVARKTEEFGWGGRVAVGHVTQLSTVPADRFAAIAKTLASAGVAVTVLPATDLYLIGRSEDHKVQRGVTHAHKLTQAGVNCSISTNNVMNPFTPYGDASLIRMANLYANVCHASRPQDLADCLAMITTRSAELLRLDDYGVAVGKAADFVLLDAETPELAVAELAPVLAAYKAGKRTVTRPRPELHRG